MNDQAGILPNDSPIGGSFWQKDSLITHILFELCLFRYLAQSTYFRDTLYYECQFLRNPHFNGDSKIARPYCIKIKLREVKQRISCNNLTSKEDLILIDKLGLLLEFEKPFWMPGTGHSYFTWSKEEYKSMDTKQDSSPGVPTPPFLASDSDHGWVGVSTPGSHLASSSILWERIYYKQCMHSWHALQR